MKKFLYLLLCLITLQASAQYANGKIKIYFNRPVDNALATNYPAVFLNQILSDTLCAYINRAKYTIDVAQYDYLNYSAVTNIATAINNAYSRGVTVRWVYNGSSPNTGLTLLNSNIKTLGSPTTSSYGIMHDKFVIIDANSGNANDAYVWTGSADWSQEQMDSDVNNIIIFQDQPLARAYTAEFNQMWGGTGSSPVTASEKFGPNKTDLGPHIFTIGGSTVELYFSPKDSTNDHILDAINSANSQLFFGVYTFTETNDANAIVARKNAGVVTAGIIDQYSSSYGAAPILSAGLGSMLKTYTQSTSIYHSKFVIADPCNTSSDPLVLTGSHNWSSSADTKNDENTVVVHNADVANIYYQAFYQNFIDLGGTLAPCTVTNPCNISVTAAVNSNVLCYGQSTGKATAHAHGTHGPFSYSWSSAPAQTDSVLNNVAAGSYTVTVIDANSCSATASVTISQPAALGVSVTGTNLTCNGSGDGTATANPSGGTATYQYKWSSAPQQTTSAASSLGAGTFTVTVTDANSCTVTGSVTITQPSAIVINSSVTNISCLNGSNGSIAATATGGSGGYHYLWSTTPQQTTATASGLTAGSYAITVTDLHNCSASASYNVTQPLSGITLSTSTSSASCGGNTGSATVNVLTGTGSFIYNWSNGGTAATINNLAAGSYHVTVSNTGGCSATSAALVNSSGGPSVVANSSNTSCGNNNGSATVSVSGGSQPYTYLWSNGATVASVSGLASGAYTVTVQDNNHCASIASVTVTPSNGLVLGTSSTPATCGGNNGSATVTVNNATNPVFGWSNGSTTQVINNIAGGNYTVTVTDGGNCSASASVTVGSGSGGNGFTITADKTTLCFGDSANLCAITGYTSYQWSNSLSGYCIYVKQSGNYTVTASGNGCTATSSPISITVYPAYNITFATTGDTLIATNAVSYQWQLNGTPVPGATSETWIATQSGNYSVISTDVNNCTAGSGQKYVNVTGITELNNSGYVNIYPNPLSGGNWQLEVSNDWLGSLVELFDASGKVVYRTETRNLRSEISVDLAQGIYLLKITSNDKSRVKKLVKL